jgi:hypothetical protein
LKIPEKVNAAWVESLGDAQLISAEAALRKQFAEEESAEKERKGPRYSMFRGPASLMTAWTRWLLVSNEAIARRVAVKRRIPT